MAKELGCALATPRHGDVGTALLREYTVNHSGIGVIYRALDLLVAHFELDDAALVVDGSDLGVQVFRARRRPLGPDLAWLFGAEPGLYTSPKAKVDTSLLPVLCAIALDLDVEHHDAGHDALTGLANRRRLHDTIDLEVRRAARTGTSFGVLAFDLVDFKRFNENYGYETGDDALRAFARALRAEARATDTVGRWGGDEFVIVALADKAEQLVPLVARVRHRLERNPLAGTEVVAFRESRAIMYPGDGVETGEILARALGSLKPN
ncbi:MAG: GGDEF domain-containing protein [Acidimicrobiia bacterium]